MSSRILDFYDSNIGASCDDYHSDYKLEDILQWGAGARRLETRHDYIQHLFPLPEPSPFNSGAAVVTEQVRDAFLARAELQINLLRAFLLMCGFYGFDPEYNGGEHLAGKLVSLARGRHFTDRSHTWARHFDHNHLRMTRIIRSIRILGLEHEARLFYETLVQESARLGDVINQRSIGLWRHAAYGPLHVPPSHNDPEVEWLRPAIDHPAQDVRQSLTGVVEEPSSVDGRGD